MLWQNSPSVVVGKHQNAFAEINLPFLATENIPVIRRISGGGTVFHDEGNLNYSLIKNEKNRERMIDFKKFSHPVIEFLKTLNLEAETEGKNNLVIGSKKISGNAAHVHKNRVMHHGTLLFSSKLDILDKTIKPPEVRISDKAVQSVRATVGNISDFLEQKIDIKIFKELLFEFLCEFHSVLEVVDLTKKQKKEIADLATEKYKTWDWNFGYSPGFSIKNSIEGLKAEIHVKNGVIQNIHLSENDLIPDILLQNLAGLRFKPNEIEKAIRYSVNDEILAQRFFRLFGFFYG